VTGLEVTAYKSLSRFQSRDNQSIQVSMASLPDGAIQVLLSQCGSIVMTWNGAIFCMCLCIFVTRIIQKLNEQHSNIVPGCHFFVENPAQVQEFKSDHW